MDDAAALRVSDDLVVLFTADFITPLVDDARTWGRIAAANALSDIYAMGARPLAALNLVCWPADLAPDLLLEVLQGGAAAAAEAACLIVGGHTVEDREPKYGMAVIGLTRPDSLVRNRGAQSGDLLYLTKPLGTGIIATAIKAELAGEDEIAAAVASMTALNGRAADAAVAAGVHAMTDVTGFGLAGHLTEMLGDGGLGAEIRLDALPLLPGIHQHIAMGMVPRGAYRNRDAYATRLVSDPVSRNAVNELILFDPQTSGGLLAAIPPSAAAAFEAALATSATPAAPIGCFTSGNGVRVMAGDEADSPAT